MIHKQKGSEKFGFFRCTCNYTFTSRRGFKRHLTEANKQERKIRAEQLKESRA